MELLTSGESLTRDDLMSRLYKEPNRNAFDNIRKRLIKRIFECVVSEMASQEDDPLGYTLGLMMLCHRMAGRRAPAVVLVELPGDQRPAARSRCRHAEHRRRSFSVALSSTCHSGCAGSRLPHSV